MATRKGFQALAKKLINGSFSDFRDPIILTTVEADYDAQANVVTDTNATQGIRLEYSKRDIGGQIQVGDYEIIMLKQGLTIDVRADNTEMTFNGTKVTIVNVTEDPANATYTIQARNK